MRGCSVKVSGSSQLHGANSNWVIFNYRQTRQGQTPCQFCCLFIHFSRLLGKEKQNACHSPLCSSQETEKDKGDRDPWVGHSEWKARLGRRDREDKAVWVVGRGAVCREGPQRPKRGHPVPSQACVCVCVCARGCQAAASRRGWGASQGHTAPGHHPSLSRRAEKSCFCNWIPHARRHQAPSRPRPSSCSADLSLHCPRVTITPFLYDNINRHLTSPESWKIQPRGS